MYSCFKTSVFGNCIKVHVYTVCIWENRPELHQCSSPMEASEELTLDSKPLGILLKLF